MVERPMPALGLVSNSRFWRDPILCRFPLHCGRVRVLALDPVERTPRYVTGVFALRDYALEPELTCMLENNRTITGDVLLSPDPATC